MAQGVVSAIVRRHHLKSTGQIASEAQAVLRQFAAELVAEMADYPPQIPGTKYARTGRLARGWRLRNKPRTGVEVYNAVRYSGDVEGPPGIQLEEFGEKRGWQNITDTTEEVLDRYEGLFLDAISAIPR